MLASKHVFFLLLTCAVMDVGCERRNAGLGGDDGEADFAALSASVVPVATAAGAPGLTGFVYHFGNNASLASPPQATDIATMIARVAALTPSSAFTYPQSGTEFNINMHGGDVTPTNSYIGASAVGTSATDTNPLGTTAIDFVGAVHFSQAGSYKFNLQSADDAAAVYLGGSGVPGSGALVGQLNYAGALFNGGQFTIAQPGWYALEVFWFNQYFGQAAGGAQLNFLIQGPAPVQYTGAMMPGATPSQSTSGLQASVFHRIADTSLANPPTSDAIKGALAYAASATPSYSFTANALSGGASLALSGGDLTATKTFLGSTAAGAAATDTTPLQTTMIDFTGSMVVTQAGTYSVTLAAADDAAAFFIGGDGITPGHGTTIVQRNWDSSITTVSGGANPQKVYLVAGTYPVELFYYNQTLTNGQGGAGLSFGVSGPAAVSFVSAGMATSPKVLPQWFYAGACIGTVLRAEAIPGRTFFAADGKTVQDPFDTLAQAGLNAARVEAFINQCDGASPAFDNSGDVIGREMNFQLDGGCIDIQVKTAQQAKAHNMKVVLTLNMGFDIPVAWQGYNYTQMLGAIDGEVRRQLAPFLRANIVPDIILLENEGSDGILYNITLPTGESYARGTGNNSHVSAQQLQEEVCGQLPTGNMASYPQLAGYYKQEILSSRDAIRKAGFDDATTRFGLHSHGQYVDWKQSVVYSTNPNQETIYTGNGVVCGFDGVIPQNILSLRASDMLDIMGFSSYAEPMAPVDPTSEASLQAAFTRLRATLNLMDAVAQRYGKYSSGPFTGQYKKQGLGVEYASAFVYPGQISYQQRHTQIYFQTLKAYPWFLGAMWWEPTYKYNNWEGGNATLYYNFGSGTQTNEAPTATLQTWGSFANSPKSP